MNEYKLSDEVISHVAQCIQLAILTGTDVVDNLRTVRVTESVSSPGEIVLTDSYRLNSENNIQKMVDEVESLSEKTRQ